MFKIGDRVKLKNTSINMGLSGPIEGMDFNTIYTIFETFSLDNSGSIEIVKLKERPYVGLDIDRFKLAGPVKKIKLSDMVSNV